ncbi:hypothetical protein [Methylophilus sp. 3sh_L]|uniref:hypothetical protein n=1 Tax=Methylophilus sp. 3sh_L TaxID=3377114 RepID=UPI00398EB8DC
MEKLDISAVTVEVQKLTLKTSDILILKVPVILSRTENRAILSYMQDIRGDGGKVVVIDETYELKVIEHKPFKFILKMRCWLFGCEAHPQEYCHSDDHLFTCIHCGEEASYSDMVGDTRINRFKSWINYWLFRKWWPVKCSDCGHRFGCDESVDHVPF